jgi:hypothetical protein
MLKIHSPFSPSPYKFVAASQWFKDGAASAAELGNLNMCFAAKQRFPTAESQSSRQLDSANATQARWIAPAWLRQTREEGRFSVVEKHANTRRHGSGVFGLGQSSCHRIYAENGEKRRVLMSADQPSSVR